MDASFRKGIARLVTPRKPRGELELSRVLALCIQEILPEDMFEVTSEKASINVRGRGRCRGASLLLMPTVYLQLPLPAARRLKLLFENESRNLQVFIGRALEEPWPSVGAEAHVVVDREGIDVWWGGPKVADAPVRLRRLTREELGI